MSDISGDSPDESKKSERSLEKIKIGLDFVKWLVGSVALVWATSIIDNGFKERSAGVQEMQAFDKYVEVILKANNIEERWKLSEFFSTVTPTDRLRDRWVDYNKLIKPDYDTFKSLKKQESLVRDKPKTPESTLKLNSIKRKLEPFEKKLVNTNYAPDVSFMTTSPNISVATIEPELKNFKEKIQKDSYYAGYSKLKGYFDKVKNLNDSVVTDIQNEVGEQFHIIQTGTNFNYKESTFSNQTGLVSAYDESRKMARF